MRTLVVCALLLAAPAVRAADLPPAPNGVVADVAHLYSPDERAAFEALGRQILADQKVVLRVLTLPDSKGEAPKAIAVRTLNSWKVGERSVLLLVVMNPRALYLQPGTALSSIFDARTSAAICEGMAPQMRSKAFADAAQTGLWGIRNRLAAGVKPTVAAATPFRQPENVLWMQFVFDKVIPGVALVGLPILGIYTFYKLRNDGGPSGTSGTWDSYTSNDSSSSSSSSSSDTSSSSDSSGGGGSSW
jgi:uncharacterized membrane protein YgcG